MELSNSLVEDITKIPGVNEELLGSATDDKSGILSMLRQGAGLITNKNIVSEVKSEKKKNKNTERKNKKTNHKSDKPTMESV